MTDQWSGGAEPAIFNVVGHRGAEWHKMGAARSCGEDAPDDEISAQAGTHSWVVGTALAGSRVFRGAQQPFAFVESGPLGREEASGRGVGIAGVQG